MKTITPYRTAVTNFAASAPAQKQQGKGFEYDSGEYILSIASPVNSYDASTSTSTSTSTSQSSIVAAALSNQSIVLYDTNIGQVTNRIEHTHDGPISQIQFMPRVYQALGSSPLIISASEDGTAKIWDIRSKSNQAAITMKLQLPNEQALSISTGYSGTLCAVGTNKARISFFDLRYAANQCGKYNKPSGNLMGSYVDAHTDEVTCVQFQTVRQSPTSNEYKTVLVTASEDGLVAIHDPSQPTEDAALLSVLNIGAPLRNAGFFGPCYEGLYALTGSETMSVHHWDSAQKVSDVGGVGLRELLSNAVVRTHAEKATSLDNATMSDDGGCCAVEYLVGCTWSTTPASPASPALHLLAGNSNGDGYLFRMDADQITPLIHLKGGHRGCIRDFCWVDNDNGMGGGKRLVTGGEDARLCEWDLSGNQQQAAASFGSSSGSTKSSSSKWSGRAAMNSSKSKGGSKVKGKKKCGSPY